MQNKVSTNINILRKFWKPSYHNARAKENGKGIQRTFYPLDEETRLI
jgi:hypothetical protein